MGSGRRPKGLGALAGVVAVAVAVGAAQVTAGLVNPESSPVITVGQSFIDATPEWLKHLAISAFGTHDKTALLTGIGAVMLILAVVLGVVATSNRRAGWIGMVAFGAVGVIASLTRPGARVRDALPSIVGAVAGVWMIGRLLDRLEVTRAGPATTEAPLGTSEARPGVIARQPAESPTGVDRRRFLAAAGFGAGLAIVAGGVGRFIGERSRASASRATVRIPSPATPPPPPPPGLSAPGLSPFITPNDAFYRIDTALLAPAIDADTWSLHIHGMVDREMTITYKELLARPLIEADITLCCVSNEVGGNLISNARWIGAPLKDLLAEAGVHSGATQLVSKSADGFTVGTPVAAVTDGRNAMLAIAMNGEPLPITHGFPVRQVVPGLYGYVSATKWIVDMELTTFDAYDAYWVKRGWAQQAPVLTQSRIDTPRDGANLSPGDLPIAGVAWAQHRGIAAVHVQIDGGAWQEAQLAQQDTIDTWRQWLLPWKAPSGSHAIAVRATDQTGAVQTAAQQAPFPSGATGYHTITVTVS